MVLDAFLLNTQHYKVQIKGKVEQSKEKSWTPLHLSVVAIEGGGFWVILGYDHQFYLLHKKDQCNF